MENEYQIKWNMFNRPVPMYSVVAAYIIAYCLKHAYDWV